MDAEGFIVQIRIMLSAYPVQEDAGRPILGGQLSNEAQRPRSARQGGVSNSRSGLTSLMR